MAIKANPIHANWRTRIIENLRNMFRHKLTEWIEIFMCGSVVDIKKGAMRGRERRKLSSFALWKSDKPVLCASITFLAFSFPRFCVFVGWGFFCIATFAPYHWPTKKYCSLSSLVFMFLSALFFVQFLHVLRSHCRCWSCCCWMSRYWISFIAH